MHNLDLWKLPTSSTTQETTQLWSFSGCKISRFQNAALKKAPTSNTIIFMKEQVSESFQYMVELFKQFPKHVQPEIWGFCTSYILKWSFKSCHFRKNHVQKWHTWWRHKVVMTSFQQLLKYPNTHTNRLSSIPGVGSCPIFSFVRDIRAPKWYV